MIYSHFLLFIFNVKGPSNFQTNDPITKIRSILLRMKRNAIKRFALDFSCLLFTLELVDNNGQLYVKFSSIPDSIFHIKQMQYIARILRKSWKIDTKVNKQPGMLFPKYILRRIINDVIKDGFPRICIIVRLSTFIFLSLLFRDWRMVILVVFQNSYCWISWLNFQYMLDSFPRSVNNWY